MQLPDDLARAARRTTGQLDGLADVLPDGRQLRVAELDGLRVARVTLLLADALPIPPTVSSPLDEVARRNGAPLSETRADDQQTR